MGNAAVDVLANGSRSKIKLDVFEGQLDLLLYLMKKEKANVYDIPMERITNQYMEFNAPPATIPRAWAAETGPRAICHQQNRNSSAAWLRRG
jgi:hypothetical protein